MSYDLMVFDPNVAPRERVAFGTWFEAQAQWAEDRDYSDPAGTAPKLVAFYRAMLEHFPAMNGPDATDDDDAIDRAVEYSIGSSVIYAAFGWSDAERAYATVRKLAVECEVGFYDVSGDEGDGEIYFPGDELRPAPDAA